MDPLDHKSWCAVYAENHKDFICDCRDMDGSAEQVQKVGPGIALSNGREVKYCICEERDGDNAECPIHK